MLLSVNLFKGLSNLQTLDLDDNKIIHIDIEMFRDLINLQILYLGHNRLKTLTFN